MFSSIGKSRLEELSTRAGLRGASRGVVIAVALLCVAIAAFAVYRWWPHATEEGSSGFSISQVPEPAPSSGEAQSGGSAVPVDSSAEETIAVHVAGAVMRPGIVYCPPGSRVHDAINLAGGFLGNAAQDALNLARVIADGEQIYVPTIDEVQSGKHASRVSGQGVSGQGGQQGADARVDLNTADMQALDTLPGIGPALAQRIIADREKNGPFATPEDLKRVPGIGEKKFEALADLVAAN